MSTHQEDLDLLLSLQEDRVLETPPGSPRQEGHLSDDGSPRERGQADMSAFRNVVKDCLDDVPETVGKSGKSGKSDRLKKLLDPQVEKFSGLRMRNQLVTSSELSERFSDIRFVRLPAIKNLLAGDTISGCWATAGVLIEKGYPKTSSIGQKYSIWKIAYLDETVISVFLFGDAYEKNCKEEAGMVFALFNCAVRKAGKGSDFSLSVSSASRILKLGTSVDYGVCKGKGSGGVPCTAAINKRKGVYCSFHKSKAAKKFSSTRTELKGGNLKTAFRHPYKPEGIYMVDRTNLKNAKQPVKILSVEGLRKALSKADKVTTNTHSQGLRFLNEMTAERVSTTANKAVMPGQQTAREKRKTSTEKSDSSTKQQPDTKRQKPEQGQPLADISKLGTGKMIELNYVSSDEEI
ncbi:hypothetical protein Ddye_004151 [Dipteronia dyeriana]|uniref:Zinc finger Mcm10/DnaG-type domain-containing protein n=1 Tax=Dipteronia dyeriana TaxID=168575 RepID=A0AAE0CVY9_9ROSI|nr:hypothetical protein Ddye_004151 [Dipteronia dyeriana]